MDSPGSKFNSKKNSLEKKGNTQERNASEVTCEFMVQTQEMEELHMLASNWNKEAADNLNKNNDLIHKKDIHGRTPLHMAALFNCAEMAEWLVGRGAGLEERTYQELQTPTHYAARYGSIPTLKLLLASGSDLEAKDYNGRTPLHLAINLDRTLVVEYLVSLPQPADVLTKDNLGNIAISCMIISTPGVAYKALDKYHTVRATERKDCFNLFQMETDVYEDCITTKTPFEAAVEESRAHVLLHPIMKAFYEVMWKFIRPYFFVHLITYLLFTLMWSFDFAYDAFHERRNNVYPRDLWRAFLSGIILILYFTGIMFDVVIIIQLLRHHKIYRRNRKSAIQSDINTLVHTDDELQFLKNKKSKLRHLPRYFSDPWTYLSWLSKILILCGIAAHIYVPITNQVRRYNDISRYGCFATIVIWVLLLKFLRASSGFAPLLSLLFRIRIFHFLLIGLIFYIPYVLSFWVMFGGGVAHNITDADTTALDSIQSISVMVFRMTLLDDYPYEVMKQIDPLMTVLLVVSFLLIMAIIGVNVFIALLSSIVEQVYEDTLASAALQQASLLYSYNQLFFCFSTKKKYLKYIKKHCNPYIKEYNERQAMKKAKSKVSLVKMSEMVEEIIQRGDKINEELEFLGCEIKEMKNTLCKASNPIAAAVEEQLTI